jgi:maltooligosyltrehalose trehalohydrolase
MKQARRYPIGAEIIPQQGVHFRVWAPDHKEVTLVLENHPGKSSSFPMKPEKSGYFSLLVPDAKKGTLYRFKLGRSKQLMTDPASRFQPMGINGPSCVVDTKHHWTDQKWPGLQMKQQILYEIHIGTFTQEGTFKAAMKQLKELASLGITTLEIMPINEFPGKFGWGYDGTHLFAPTHLYGTPSDVKAFINKAHALGLGVILDVVYNHLGPEGSHMLHFSKDYLNKKLHTDWGKPVNFDSSPVREFFLANVRYWIEEYHFDGLRVDATPWFFSSTPVHILADLTKTAKEAAGKKDIIVIGENEPQDAKLLRPYKKGGYGFDALWNEDFHHTAHVRLTGKREAYYTDYLGSPQEFISAIKYGFLYQGQYYDWQKKTRGVPSLDLSPESLIVFLENHDQIANSGHGKRLHLITDPGNYKALICLFLLSRNTPMLFQGQEFYSERPFFYFADHSEAISERVYQGRIGSLAQFPRLATSEIRKLLPDPADPSSFSQCKLDFRDREKHASFYSLYKHLIKLRKTDAVFQKIQEIKIDGAILGVDSFLIRYFGGKDGDRLLIINFGDDHYFNPAPEPLLVAGIDLEWEIIWSSESPLYGGEGTPPINVPYWKILGHSAIVLKTKKVARKNK